MKKIFFILLFISAGFTISNAQTSLKLSQVKTQFWNTSLSKWSGWPNQWQYYSSGNEPVVKITNLDDSGVKFRIGVWASNDYYSFIVTYNGYDNKNKWYIYKDSDGNDIRVFGSTLSSLARYGWPENQRVQIYFWLYSENYAMVLE